tara:strand:- start:54 stop:227 length:174 start_codon:yes stop_codon:yes gene_type:complete
MASVSAEVFEVPKEEIETNNMYLLVCFLIVLTLVMFIKKLIATFYRPRGQSYEAKLE